MQQGHAYILIARFPDPNYGVKTTNFYNKLPSPIVSSLSVPRCVTYRPLFRSHLSIQRKSLFLLRQNEGNYYGFQK